MDRCGIEFALGGAMDVYSFPFRFRSLIIYIIKATATFECKRTDTRYAIGNCYARKAIAIIERTTAYARDAIRYRYACKARAIIER